MRVHVMVISVFANIIQKHTYSKESFLQQRRVIVCLLHATARI